MFKVVNIKMYTIFIGILLVILTIVYIKYRHQYWQRRGLPILPNFNAYYGHLGSPNVRTKTLGLKIKNIYDEMRAKKWKHGGFYILSVPFYFILDPTLIKHILTKDFNHFVDRGLLYHNEKYDPISAHLFAIGAPKWFNLRSKLSPAFTSGKIKMMLSSLLECVEPLCTVMEQYCKKTGPIDIKEVFGCFSTDVIGKCAFGLECNSFTENNSPFREYGKKFFILSSSYQLKNGLADYFPRIAAFFRYKPIDKEVSNFFINIVRSTIDHRARNNYRRPDFIQLLIDMKNKEPGRISVNEIVAQATLFFLANFETSSSTMTFAFYELARNQNYQTKARDEINEVMKKYNGKITYDALQELKYLNQVIEETLRMYPSLPFISRACVNDYKVPDENLVVEKGTKVWISVLGLHLDPDYFPEPEKFDPERFSEANRRNIKPFTYIPFGAGPRICIGLRFGLMQTKIGLVSLLKNFQFTVNERTQEPIEFEKNSIFLTVKGGIWLNVNTFK